MYTALLLAFGAEFLDFYTPLLCLPLFLSSGFHLLLFFSLPFENKCMSIVHDTILFHHLLLNIIASLSYYLMVNLELLGS